MTTDSDGSAERLDIAPGADAIRLEADQIKTILCALRQCSLSLKDGGVQPILSSRLIDAAMPIASA
jgi:hypothetical protein